MAWSIRVRQPQARRICFGPCKRRRCRWTVAGILLLFWASHRQAPSPATEEHGNSDNHRPPSQQESEKDQFAISRADQSLLLKERFGVWSTASDVAYLDHCDLDKLDPRAFDVFQKLLWELIQEKNHPHWSSGSIGDEQLHVRDVQDEIKLQALEHFARGVQGACNFSLYHPSVPEFAPIVPGTMDKTKRLIQSLYETPKEQARLVFAISAYNDMAQLRRLLQAISLPQHLIVIHLERRTPATFIHEAQQLASHHPNLVVLQFGSVIYPSDTLSHVMLQIMRWVTHDLNFQYDYFIALGSTSYPLWNAIDMAHFLRADPPRVRLGRLAHSNPRRLCVNAMESLGLLYTRGDYYDNHRRPLDIGGDRATRLYQDARAVLSNQSSATNENAMPLQRDFWPAAQFKCRKFKSVSGLTAAYNYDAIRSLLASADALDLLNRFKYAGGCCVEERSWAAAMAILGRGKEITLPGLVWQSWPVGVETMHNSWLQHPNKTVVATNQSEIYVVYQTEHYHSDNDKWFRHIRGMEVAKELREAKESGMLFARKFQSSDVFWQKWIEGNLHHSVQSKQARADQSYNG